MRGEALRCRDLFELAPLQGSKLIAGSGGLDRPIERVNVMEVPDVAEWVRPGEFLMTTGYPFRGDPELFAEMLPKLAEKGIAAIGIKTKRFVDAIPPSVVRLGDELGLCVIELPPNTVFSDVVAEVMEHVLNGRLHQLNALQERVSLATQILMEGGQIRDLLACAESFVRNPIALLSPRGDWWMTEETGRRLGPAFRDADPRRQRPRRTEGAFAWEDEGRRWHAWPLSRDRDQPALLVLLEELPLSRLDRMTVEKLGAVAGLELANLHARQTIEYQYRDQYLHDWLTGRIGVLSDLQLRAEICGAAIDPRSRTYGAAILRRDGAAGSAEDRELLAAVRKSDLQARRGIEATLLQDQLVFVLPGREGVQELAACLRQAAGGAPISLCLGKTVGEATSLPDSYAEARRIARIAAMSGIDKEVVTYDELGVYPLLLQLAGSEELPKFLATYIAPLTEQDHKQEGSLIATLRCYFQCGRNAKAAAGKLFTHYNTVLYRLERVSALLGLDLGNPDTCFQLELALKLHELTAMRTPDPNNGKGAPVHAIQPERPSGRAVDPNPAGTVPFRQGHAAARA